MKDVYIDLRECGNVVTDEFDLVDFISLDDFISKFEDVVLEKERLQEIIEDMKNSEENSEWNIADELNDRMKIGDFE